MGTWAFYGQIDSEFVDIIEFVLELFCEFWWILAWICGETNNFEYSIDNF